MRRRGYSSKRTYINKYRRADRKRRAANSRNTASARQAGDLGRLSLTLLTAVALLISLVMIFGNRANAKTEEFETYNGYYKYFTSITVHAGDTLSDYAEMYNIDEIKSDAEYISEVCMINDIDKDHIVSGSVLIVPYYDKEFK